MQKPKRLTPAIEGPPPERGRPQDPRPKAVRGRPVAGTDKRLQILDGARQAFIRQGFDAVSILDENGDVAATLTRLGEQFVEISAQDWAIRAQRTVLGVAERMPQLARDFYESGAAKAEQRLALYFEAEAVRGHLKVPDPQLAARQFIALCLAEYSRPRLYQAMPEPPAPASVKRAAASAVAMFLAVYDRKPPGK